MADKPHKLRRLSNVIIDCGTYGDEAEATPPLPPPGEIGRPIQYPPDQVISKMAERLKQGRITKAELFKEMQSWTKERFGTRIGHTLFHEFWQRVRDLRRQVSR